MSKYGARRTEAHGMVFASAGEARRYGELLLLERAGAIQDLETQPVFPLVVNGQKVGTYIADFRYTENGERITEDFKGVKTPVYRLKKKLVAALYGVTIRETAA